MNPQAATRTTASLAILLAASAGCILPDDGIVVSDPQLLNRSAVRIVEPLRLSQEANDACDELDPDIENEICPQPPPNPEALLPHFLDPQEYLFCSCPMGSVDSEAQPNFEIYVEDRDQDVDGNYDDIYAALLLDYTPENSKPYKSIRYREYVNPQDPIPQAGSYQPLGRHNQTLRVLGLGNADRNFDFCNGATDTALEAGFHTLTVIVSDRPWFTPEDVMLEGEEILEGVIQEGVPDFVEGATFDLSTYVFYCTAADEDPCQSSQCKTIEEPL